VILRLVENWNWMNVKNENFFDIFCYCLVMTLNLFNIFMSHDIFTDYYSLVFIKEEDLEGGTLL